MRVIYWDSDCFLGWILDEVGKADLCGLLLQECESGKTRIVTSTLTIAEVLAVPKQQKIPLNKRQLVEGFFKREFIVTRGLTSRVAEHARTLVWDHGIMPKDAVHVATAIDAKLDDLHTFDGDLIKQSGKHGSPLLRIRAPYVEPTLFNLPN